MRHKSRLAKYCHLYFYTTARGNVPFKAWYKKLDVKVRARVFRRLERLEYYGEWGVFRFLKGAEKLMEIKFHMRGGYRIYCTTVERGVLIFLGGDKSTQNRDIKLARKYYNDFDASRYCLRGEE